MHIGRYLNASTNKGPLLFNELVSVGDFAQVVPAVIEDQTLLFPPLVAPRLYLCRLFFFASSISLFISRRFLVLCECDFFFLPTPVFLFAINLLDLLLIII